jgi:2-polyprenyl-6-methoxyphenol hydroxylase-like FAD-dependent oxidoreductase
MTEARQERVAVTIVGGGPIGMTMGLLLGRFGIPCEILERNAATTDHPKARGCFARTMELFRIWGIDKPIRERGLPDGADHWTVGRSVADLHTTRPEIDPKQTPVWKSVVAQDAVEEELLKAVRGYATTQLRFATECLGFEQDEAGVTAQCLDQHTESAYTLRSDYLIACDGAGSRMRKLAAIPMTGIPSISYMANDYLRVDLSDVPLACAAAGMILAPHAAGEPWISILNSNGRDRWLVLRRIGADRDERTHIPSDEEVIADAKRRLGIERKVEVINRSTWRSAREVAARYHSERVFLVGDAAHRFLPTGGQGMNTGIADAHNLAWKLAFVLNGHAGADLLASYNLERQPIGKFTVEQAYTRYVTRTAPYLGATDYEPQANDFNIELGYLYHSPAVISEGSSDALHEHPDASAGRPGSRAPHLWIEKAGHPLSTLDLFNTDFVLLAAPGGAAWLDAAQHVASHFRGLPFVAYRFGDDLADPSRRFGALYGLNDTGAALIRPDGFVGWRAPTLSPDPESALREALASLLAKV